MQPDGGELGGEDRLAPGHRDERGRREVVDLVRPAARQHVHERQLVEDVGLDQLDLVANADEVVEAARDGLPHDSEDVVALGEEQLGEQRAVLSGDPDDERSPAVHRRAP